MPRPEADHHRVGRVHEQPGESLVASLLELVLPRACLGCGRPGRTWCWPCLAGELDPVLHRPDPSPPGLPLLAAAAAYSASVRAAMLAAKERDRRELDRPLGLLLATAVATVCAAEPGWCRAAPLWLVPVPSSPSAIRVRGRDHVRDLTLQASRALREAGVPASRLPVLRRSGAGVDSVGLDAGQRADNVAGVFSFRAGNRPTADTTFVIVDDIVTTGATLVETSRALATGLGVPAARICAAVVAATERTGHSTESR